MKTAEAVIRKGSVCGSVLYKGEIRIRDGKNYNLIEFHYAFKSKLTDAMTKTATALGYELEWRE